MKMLQTKKLTNVKVEKAPEALVKASLSCCKISCCKISCCK